MAGLNDRGQILLIGALVMAITFISLSIVLNGSLHTPSVAAQASDDITGNELDEIQDTIQREGTELMKRAENESSGASDQRSYVEGNISSLGDELAAYYVRQDMAVNISGVDARSGGIVSGSPPASFDSVTVRAFNVDTSSRDENITIDNGSSYVIEVSNNKLTVNGDTCTYSNSISRIEVTNATTDRGPCQALEFIEDIGTNYDLYINSTGSGATYEFIGRNVSTSHLDFDQAGVYDVEVPITIYSPSMTYNGTIEVAPGKP